GSGQASLGRQDETLAVDIGRESLDPDQLATEFFETVIVETKAELNPAIGDAALGDEAPEDLLQHPLKVHASAPVRHDLSSLLDVLLPPGRHRASASITLSEVVPTEPSLNLSRHGRFVKCERPDSAQRP
ncbi:MAG: hypothetical protein WB696_13700, partial [Chthoniobacterales bacterium]